MERYAETTCSGCMELVTDAPVCPHCRGGVCETCFPSHRCCYMPEEKAAFEAALASTRKSATKPEDVSRFVLDLFACANEDEDAA